MKKGKRQKPQYNDAKQECESQEMPRSSWAVPIDVNVAGHGLPSFSVRHGTIGFP